MSQLACARQIPHAISNVLSAQRFAPHACSHAEPAAHAHALRGLLFVPQHFTHSVCDAVCEQSPVAGFGAAVPASGCGAVLLLFALDGGVVVSPLFFVLGSGVFSLVSPRSLGSSVEPSSQARAKAPKRARIEIVRTARFTGHRLFPSKVQGAYRTDTTHIVGKCRRF